MGLGKSLQSLAWLQLHPEARPAIIVCPASLKINWAKEIAQCMSDDTEYEILSGTLPDLPRGAENKVLIINYEVLANWADALRSIEPQVVITDEAHKYKNNEAKRTKAVKKLCKGVPHMIALTGTPVVSRPIEMYNALKLVDASVVPSFWQYAKRYCDAHHDGFGWNMKGASNTEELHEKLVNTVMIRRRKDDVLQDLPDKVHGSVPFEIDNRPTYERASRDFIAYLQEQYGKAKAERASNSEMLARINGLKQLAAEGKVTQAIDWIDNQLQDGGKLVVFAHHTKIIDAIREAFSDRAVKFDGKMGSQQRDQAVERFQGDDNCQLFVGNMQAAGVGLTLTAASRVAFVELPWTPGELVQAEDRCHRIGQSNAVHVYYLVGMDTIDEYIADLLSQKRQVIDSVIDGQETDESSMLSELINSYRQEEAA